MKLYELKKVLAGDIKICERNPDYQEAERTGSKDYFRDLYAGDPDMIPEHLLQREVNAVLGWMGKVMVQLKVALMQ